MGIKNSNRAVRAKARQVFNVPIIAGNYANERITFGATVAGNIEEQYDEIQALAEGSNNSPFITGCTVELWLPRLVDAATPVGSLTDSDYTLAGSNLAPLTAAGAIRWDLAMYSGGQIRVKSGGFAGQQAVSASAM